MSYAQGAVAALREALHHDSTYAPAARLLADPELRRLARLNDNGDAELIRRTSRASGDAGLLLSLAARELEWRRPDSALAFAARAADAGGDIALVELIRARGLLMQGRLQDGETAWLDGFVAAQSGAAVAAYRQDLGWIATDLELSAVDSLVNNPTLDRRRWARTFWARRGAADFRPPAARLAEHEKRVRFARREFAVRNEHRDYNSTMPFRSDQQLIDDRGVVYIRHGPPSHIVETGGTGPGSCPVYSWIYDSGPDSGLMVHFRPFFSLLISPRRFCAYADFKMVPGGVWVDANVRQLAQYDTLYAKWIGENRHVERKRLERRVIATDVDRLKLAVTTDADPHHFERDLHAVVRSYPLSDPGRILVAFALPPDGLGRIDHAGSAAIPLRLRVAALPRTEPPVTLDTTILYDASRHLRPDQWLVGYAELPVSPGRYEVRTLATGADPKAGSFRLQPGVEVTEAAAGKPTVSALVLGTSASELRWPTAAGDFPLSPIDGYRLGSEIEIYLEASGLPSNARAEVRFTLAPVSKSKRNAVQLRSTEQATGTTLIVRRSLNLTGVDPGLYTLRAEVTLPNGRKVDREQRLGIAR